MEIIVLGPGCARCNKVYSAIKKIVEETGIEASLCKEEDIMKIMAYGVMMTPAIIVDGVIKIEGYVPNEKEIKKAIEIFDNIF